MPGNPIHVVVRVPGRNPRNQLSLRRFRWRPTIGMCGDPTEWPWTDVVIAGAHGRRAVRSGCRHDSSVAHPFGLAS